MMRAGSGPLAALALLAAVSSCVPLARSAPGAHSVVQAVPDADRSLLKQLDLDVSSRTGMVTSPQGSAEGAAPAFVAPVDADTAARARECLTAAVYYEARSEPVDGQRAVAQVVLNRVRDRAFPASVCGVVYQHSRKGCQFSFTCDGSMTRPIEPGAWARSGAIATAALAGLVYAPVGAATHYHANYVSPWWAPSLTRIGAVGSHIFYRWHDRMADALSFRQRYAGEEPAAFPGQAIAATGGGVSEEAGVAVHRSGDAAVAAAAAAPVEPPASGFGVRVHRSQVPGLSSGDAGDFGVSIRRGGEATPTA